MGSSSSCPVPAGSENYSNEGTSYKPMLYIAGASTIITVAVALTLIIYHLRRYRSPKEQRQIVRIVFSVIVYSVVAFGEIWKYQAAQYLDPLGDLYEAFGLCALFLLYIQYAAPAGTFNEDMFSNVKAAEELESTFNWPKIAWIFVFQYPIVEFFCVALQEVTEATGTYCLQSLSPKYAHLWLEIIESISIGFCVLSILRFRGRMKRLMRVRRGFSKLIAFKIIVFVRFFQQWVFSILLEKKWLSPSNSLSYNDILYGIPAVMTCVEMVIFSLGFWYAYSSTEYSSNVKPRDEPLPMWKAALHALNPLDLFVGMARIFPLCVEARRDGDWAEFWVTTKNSGLQGAIRKGARKYKARKNGGGAGPSQGMYQEVDDERESMSLAKPGETHHPEHPYQDTGYYSYDAAMYQPPAGSPPDESHLMAENVNTGRPRSPSGSFLTGEPYPPGYYDRSTPPSSFVAQPTSGRDMV